MGFCVLFKLFTCVAWLTMSDSFQHHGLEPTRFLCPWDFPGKTPGVLPYPFSGYLRMMIYHCVTREALSNYKHN